MSQKWLFSTIRVFGPYYLNSLWSKFEDSRYQKFNLVFLKSIFRSETELVHDNNQAKTNNNEQLTKQYQKEENDDSSKCFKKNCGN